MYHTHLPIAEAIGHILRHNITDTNGHKTLRKGHRLVNEDLPQLQALGLHTIHVAILEPDDIHENTAAHRLAITITGDNLRITPPTAGRVNLLAETAGILHINQTTLHHINNLDGLTIATLPSDTLVHPRQRVTTIKIIPFAIPEPLLTQAEAACRTNGSIVKIHPLRPHTVGVILVSSAAARPRIERSTYPAIAARVTELGSTLEPLRWTHPEDSAIATAIDELRRTGAQLLITIGETSIMDRNDTIPQGICRAGGRIEHYGAPVEPGNLLLLGYINDLKGGTIPILGAPGCARSRDKNIIDLVLPRLLADEHLTRQHIIALGHGGLLH